MSKNNFLDGTLSERTTILGLRLWAAISIGVGGFILLLLVLLMLWLVLRRASNRVSASEQSCVSSVHTVFKDIKEVDVVHHHQSQASCHLKLRDHFLIPNTFTDTENEIVLFGFEYAKEPSFKIIIKGEKPLEDDNPLKHYSDEKDELHLSGHEDDNENHCRENLDYGYTSNGASCSSSVKKEVDLSPLVYSSGRRKDPFSASGHLAFTFSFGRIPENLLSGWGHCYRLSELEIATNHFADSNILGKGGYGVVYQGLLPNGSMIAVKKLLNNRGQAEKEFKIEVETIGRIRHKNLVLLLGYCIEGSKRMLVYEYVDNGNLQQWLHGTLGKKEPLTWDNRLKIIFQTAKGLAYLHEDLDPKVVHRDVKSSNILLDKSWNVKISDFGLAKLLGVGISYIMTRVMGTFGYVAPEYASTGLLTEKSDVYSFGVLMMEVITGKDPVDHARPTGEVNLVDWMKVMIANRRFEELIDERLTEKPSARALKRALLVALKCVDPDATKRPTMGHVVHMLETDDCHIHGPRKPV